MDLFLCRNIGCACRDCRGTQQGSHLPLQGSCTQRGAGRSPPAHNLAVLLLYSCIHTAVSPLYSMHTLFGRHFYSIQGVHMSVCVFPAWELNPWLHWLRKVQLVIRALNCILLTTKLSLFLNRSHSLCYSGRCLKLCIASTSCVIASSKWIAACIPCFKLHWIKASAKWINVNAMLIHCLLMKGVDACVP